MWNRWNRWLSVAGKTDKDGKRSLSMTKAENAAQVLSGIAVDRERGRREFPSDLLGRRVQAGWRTPKIRPRASALETNYFLPTLLPKPLHWKLFPLPLQETRPKPLDSDLPVRRATTEHYGWAWHHPPEHH